MAVFDFKGKTYFVYHNGSVRGGSGFRRTACITELHFNEDGSIQEIPETAIGITGDTPYYLFSNTGAVISHENYVNSSADSDYPYMDVKVGTYYQPEKLDASWVVVDGKADPSKDSYVSIQSENKPGLYLTVNDDNTVTLAHDWNYSDGFIKSGFTKPNGTANENTTFDEAMGKAQTFHTVKGLNDSAKAVSFESVAKPGYYLCVEGGSLVVKALADCDATVDFYLDKTFPADSSAPENAGTKNSITSLKINGETVEKTDHTFYYEVPDTTTSVDLAVAMRDAKGFVTADGILFDVSKSINIPLGGIYTRVLLCAYAENNDPRVTYTVIIKKKVNEEDIKSEPVKTFSFENATDDAIAVTKAFPPVAATVTYEYVDGAKEGKAIYLPGTYGLKLCDASELEEIGENYSVSYWMKPDILGSDVDPTLTAGTFEPQYWLNLTFGRSIWAQANGKWYDDSGTITYNAGKWQLVTLAVNGDKAKLYVDGELRGNGSIAPDIMGQSGSAIYFGVNAWDAYFKGALDEVKIYNNTLDEAEVKAIAATYVDKPAEYP